MPKRGLKKKRNTARVLEGDTPRNIAIMRGNLANKKKQISINQLLSHESKMNRLSTHKAEQNRQAEKNNIKSQFGSKGVEFDNLEDFKKAIHCPKIQRGTTNNFTNGVNSK
mmetsp:Transcript_5675/g.6411  ORF Transcript_5675/g.6411 Transcript_5675/m.6411 type:complete len:111 (+) Transcript_5675:150-482(+)